MADRLHQELIAVPGLEQVTASQLYELPWKTREQILVALFQEHVSSLPVAEALRVTSRDRRLERKSEKAENTYVLTTYCINQSTSVSQLTRNGFVYGIDSERDVVRKNEERFRSEFMQSAATELSRLGAPTMITWQKLVFDKDCCSQAFRILLTKIKSSKRSSNNNNNGSASQPMRRSIALAKRFISPEHDGDDGDQNDAGDRDDDGDGESCGREEGVEKQSVLPKILMGPKSAVKPPRSVLPTRPSTKNTISGGWNSDTSVQESSSTTSNRTGEDDRFEDEDAGFGNDAAQISIQRTTPKPVVSAATSAFASKLKKSQLQSMQHETAALAEENAALRNEILHLEELVATLQFETNQRATATAAASSEAFHPARMKLLQAQNMQLQRQIALFQDAVYEREMAESMLLTSLSHWREVVESARHEANAAGAEASGAKTKDGKPAQWMMAVPSQLIDELTRVESQIAHMKKAMNIACEAKLRLGGTAAEFVKHGSSSSTSSSSASSIQFSDIYVPGIAHLRVERVKKLEAALVQTVRALESIQDAMVESIVPRLQRDESQRDKTGKSTSSRELNDLLNAIRVATLEVGALGVVVPAVRGQQQTIGSTSSSSSAAESEPLVTVAHVLRVYAAASSSTSGVNAKDRDRQLKALLKQLQASESAMERDRNQLQKQATFWKNAWAMQEQLVQTLMQRVRIVGDKKMQWAESSLVHPLRELQEVWSGFQRTAQSQQDPQRLHKNAYLPLLIDTLQRHEPVLCLEAIDQWQQYAARYNHEVREIWADYDANCQLLSSYSHVQVPS